MAISLQRTDIGQQPAFYPRQALQGDRPSALPQQGLKQAEVKHRQDVVLIRASELPDECIGEPDHQFGRGRESPGQLDVRVGAERIGFTAKTSQPPPMLVDRVVAPKKLSLKTERLGRHVDR